MDRGHTVRAALAVLPEPQRQVVFLRHVRRLTPEEVADRMGRTSGLNGLHHRGRRTLRRELERLESMPFTRPTRHAVAA